jgi:hypothetical protein
VDKCTVYGRIDDAGNFWRRRDSGTEYALVNPVELAKEAEDARIGRATIALRDKWRDRIKSDEPTTRQEEAMWRELVATIAEAIAKAKEVSQ